MEPSFPPPSSTAGHSKQVVTRLLHHGAAANSNAHVLLWVARKRDDDRGCQHDASTDDSVRSELIYASHSILNVACLVPVSLSSEKTKSKNNNKHENEHQQQHVWHVYQTLRTRTTPRFGATEQRRIITSIASLPLLDIFSSSLSSYCYGLVCGFSDGTIVVWIPTSKQHGTNKESNDDEGETREDWIEHVVVGNDDTPDDTNRPALYTAPTDAAGASITHMDGILVQYGADRNSRREVWLVTCTCDGAFLYQFPLDGVSNDLPPSPPPPKLPQTISSSAMNTVQIHYSLGHIYLLLGTAAPRHNKICVYTANVAERSQKEENPVLLRSWGYLLGHEDWITSLAWTNQNSFGKMDDESIQPISQDPSALLASSSQDARIRLWKFTTRATAAPKTTETTTAEHNVRDGPLNDDIGPADEDVDDDDDDDDDDKEQEGEARLEITTTSSITRVTLEALLIGHEGPVTSVQWHPRSKSLYGVDHILLSSSMDRSLFLWACTGTTANHANVWTPLTRVGSAGGILGGSIGSSLLGFVHARLEPVSGQGLVGHAYGGALHMWSLEEQVVDNGDSGISANAAMSVEDLATIRKWHATSCVTGHFAGVTDLCWEAESGEYLLTVSIDQTCRLWAPIAEQNDDPSKSVWVELARPQVHGYDLTTITSLSTSAHRHLIASGADEKEIRIYDAPLTTVRTLRACCNGTSSQYVDSVQRVDRAYIPSLGLSNKVSAADGAEEDSGAVGEMDSSTKVQLPLERDLGAVSLWPEVRKLFGHTTEIYCLTSTVAARTGLVSFSSSPFAAEVLMASSAKARDIEAASIRIWDVAEGKCLQVLHGAHKATVATLSFSPDGKYLASSGKDRRLCIWSRNGDATMNGGMFYLAAAIDSAHKRIIWGCHFCPYNPLWLASGSRDGVVRLWQLSEEAEPPHSLRVTPTQTFSPQTKIDTKKSDAVTALSFAPVPVQDRAILALGLECGLVELWNVSFLTDIQPTLLYVLPPSQCHIASVTTLAWKPHRQPVEENGDSPTLFLASSAMDHGCRIIEVFVS